MGARKELRCYALSLREFASCRKGGIGGHSVSATRHSNVSQRPLVDPPAIEYGVSPTPRPRRPSNIYNNLGSYRRRVQNPIGRFGHTGEDVRINASPTLWVARGHWRRQTARQFACRSRRETCATQLPQSHKELRKLPPTVCCPKWGSARHFCLSPDARMHVGVRTSRTLTRAAGINGDADFAWLLGQILAISLRSS